MKPSQTELIRHHVDALRAAQHEWCRADVPERLKIIKGFRQILSTGGEDYSARLARESGRVQGEILVAEFIPLADACRFLERSAAKILKPRKLGGSGRPSWMPLLATTVRRDPFGVVLVLAPFNYPLMLPGIQALQALAAGNAVLFKPGRNGLQAAMLFAEILQKAGLPEGLLHILDESVEAGAAALKSGVDKVVLTGSVETGRAVARALADGPVPSVMELSGNDPLIVLPGADLGLVAKAVGYGLRLNGSQTCIAPRRIIVVGRDAGPVRDRLLETITALPAAELPADLLTRLDAALTDARAAGAATTPEDPRSGTAFAPCLIEGLDAGHAFLAMDLFAPVSTLLEAEDTDQALDIVHRSPYRLGASIFGPVREAQSLAARLDAGAVCINDAIIPTVDPRAPFGGRGRSGHGATRGAEGLLEMTQAKAVFTRSTRIRPHFAPPRDDDPEFFGSFLLAAHGTGFKARLSAARRLMRQLSTRMSALK